MAASRVVVGVVALLALGGSLTGCTADARNPDPTPSPSASSASPSPSETGDRTLSLTVYGDALRLRTYREVVDAFVEENPGVRVEVTSYPNAAGGAQAALGALGSGHGPDVFLADYRYLADLVATGDLEPVDTLLEDRGLQFGDAYQRAALTAFSADARLQCMPAEVSPLVVYANRRLVRRAQFGPDRVKLPNENDTTWGWQDFLKVARSVARIDRFGPIKGAYVPLDANMLTAMVRSAGGDVVDDVFDPSELTLDSGDAQDAVTELVGLARDESVSPTRQELRRRSAIDLFEDGRLGMYVGTRDDLPRLRQHRGLRFDALPLPSLGSSTSVATMNGYCINGNSDHVGLAGDFIAFAVGEKGSRIVARSGAIVPSALDIVHEPVFTQPDQLPRSSYVYATSIRRSNPTPYSTSWQSASELVEGLLDKLAQHPDVDLETSLEKRLTRLDERSKALFGDGQ